MQPKPPKGGYDTVFHYRRSWQERDGASKKRSVLLVVRDAQAETKGGRKRVGPPFASRILVPVTAEEAIRNYLDNGNLVCTLMAYCALTKNSNARPETQELLRTRDPQTTIQLPPEERIPGLQTTIVGDGHRITSWEALRRFDEKIGRRYLERGAPPLIFD